MKIVITDGYALNPGDLSWDQVAELGELFIYDRTTEDQIEERCRNADILITNKTIINAKTIAAISNLKLICVTATGYNIVDTLAAAKRNIPVCNIPEYGTDSVAQHTIALLLELSNRVGLHAESVKNGDWVNNADWCYAKTSIVELKNKILGIVGYGKIGRQTAAVARALGMKIIFTSTHFCEDEDAIHQKTLHELFIESDFVSIHCPLNVRNNRFVDSALLSLMKPTAFLINTSRGQLINEDDLADALNKKILAGAALDVLSVEPPPSDHPLLHAINCLITPHNAWISIEARQRIMATTLNNIAEFLSGNIRNRVNIV